MVHNELRGWLMLSFADGIGPVTVRKLLEQFDSATELFNASESDLRMHGLSESLIAKLFADYLVLLELIIHPQQRWDNE